MGFLFLFSLLHSAATDLLCESKLNSAVPLFKTLLRLTVVLENLLCMVRCNICVLISHRIPTPFCVVVQEQVGFPFTWNSRCVLEAEGIGGWRVGGQQGQVSASTSSLDPTCQSLAGPASPGTGTCILAADMCLLCPSVSPLSCDPDVFSILHIWGPGS